VRTTEKGEREEGRYTQIWGGKTKNTNTQGELRTSSGVRGNFGSCLKGKRGRVNDVCGKKDERISAYLRIRRAAKKDQISNTTADCVTEGEQGENKMERTV